VHPGKFSKYFSSCIHIYEILLAQIGQAEEYELTKLEDTGYHTEKSEGQGEKPL
jgi:hypothetical protein